MLIGDYIYPKNCLSFGEETNSLTPPPPVSPVSPPQKIDLLKLTCSYLKHKHSKMISVSCDQCTTPVSKTKTPTYHFKWSSNIEWLDFFGCSANDHTQFWFSDIIDNRNDVLIPIMNTHETKDHCRTTQCETSCKV